ncbi:TetR/AcrR family transcriptional regulator [Rhodopseudomonas sp.]|uniref:TetR/AcrR family transcriptional regulator n=1 Tax=Rhodopseudomonas sp. TaxID=1078 RepID=UPI0025DB27FB|nr:TetR/AcrR family transcriptional regulator [Rhodopseudomonas sp.]
MTTIELPKRVAGKRARGKERRRQAILDAAFDLFISQGFAGTRLDEVAEQADVAKGTIYLFFKDKEDLFEKVVLGALGPTLDMLDSAANRGDIPFNVLLTRIFEAFGKEILSTRRREIVRLIIMEAPRFPRIAKFYHREVISKGIGIIRKLAQRAHANGELSSDALVRFPQLLFAPLLLSAIWESLFSRLEPLDVEGMLAAHRELLLSPSQPRSST